MFVFTETASPAPSGGHISYYPRASGTSTILFSVRYLRTRKLFSIVCFICSTTKSSCYSFSLSIPFNCLQHMSWTYEWTVTDLLCMHLKKLSSEFYCINTWINLPHSMYYDLNTIIIYRNVKSERQITWKFHYGKTQNNTVKLSNHYSTWRNTNIIELGINEAHNTFANVNIPKREFNICLPWSKFSCSFVLASEAQGRLLMFRSFV